MKITLWPLIALLSATEFVYANITIYNHTDKKLTARFYYGNEPAKSEFEINQHDSKESAIPSIKMGTEY